MKFAMNGALTIGTLDGANIEIRDAVGHENFFLFGLTAPQVIATKNAGYHPRTIYQSNPILREVVDSIAAGQFSRGDRDLFRPLLDELLNNDAYLLFADYQSYVDCQDHVAATFLDQESGRRCLSITPCAWAGSPLTGRFKSIAGTSGT
jgi:glycogen phosphorylase